MQARDLLRQGDLDGALRQLQDDVRRDPAKPEFRTFLFQLLCVLGDWDRAMTQLNTVAELNAAGKLMAEMYRPALNAEALRAEIFAGKRTPVIFGQPADWVGWIIQAIPLLNAGKADAAAELRDRAFEAAPAVGGTLDDKPFEWIADADARLGPLLEMIVNGNYYWVPFQNIREIRLEKVQDLRDLVWLPAYLTWANGGQAVGLIPARYPGSEASSESALRLARGTDWRDLGHGFFAGTGARMLATDAGEYALLQTRHIALKDGVVPASQP